MTRKPIVERADFRIAYPPVDPPHGYVVEHAVIDVDHIERVRHRSRSFITSVAKAHERMFVKKVISAVVVEAVGEHYEVMQGWDVVQLFKRLGESRIHAVVLRRVQ